MLALRSPKSTKPFLFLVVQGEAKGTLSRKAERPLRFTQKVDMWKYLSAYFYPSPLTGSR